jgi:type IV pilus assembly protein PilB
MNLRQAVTRDDVKTRRSSLRQQLLDASARRVRRSYEDLPDRTRLDGVLKEVAMPQCGFRWSAPQVMSRLDIAERVPGWSHQMRLSKNRAIDVSVPARPVRRRSCLFSIRQAQCSYRCPATSPREEIYLKYLAKPQGMILVTGPTGSGKTVSLYTGLNILNTEDTNISTCEDPAEIQMSGINQVNVHPKVGLTFASALRAFPPGP